MYLLKRVACLITDPVYHLMHSSIYFFLFVFYVVLKIHQIVGSSSGSEEINSCRLVFNLSIF